MRALTIWQPWAHLIVHGPKRIENRPWRTNYRGRLLIHAGKTVDTFFIDKFPTLIPPGTDLRRGALIGYCDLVDCVRTFDVRDEDQIEWTKGPWCWVLANVKPFSCPIPLRGQRSLFRLEARIAYTLQSAIPNRQSTIP